MIAISIEEEHRNQTHKMPVEHQPRANLIVGKQRVNKINSNSKAINKGKTTKNKKPKANKPCWNCGQVGHWAKLCPNKKAKTGQAVVNMVVGGSSGASTSGATEGYVSVQPELLTIYEPCDWLIDTGANVHVCADKSLLCLIRPSLERHKYCYVFLMKNKDEALDKFILFKNEAETQTGKKLKRLRSDRGGEYESSKFTEHCQTFGIIHEETPPYSPSSNGVAERKNRTFKDMINSLLLTSGLPKYLWGEALNTACHILNRVPLKHNTSTPFELWKGIEVNTIVEFRDAVFLEDVFPMKTGIPSSVSLDDSLASTSIPEHVEKMTNVGVNPNSASLTHEESDIPRRSKRARVVKDFGSDFVTYNIEDDPVTFKDAMASLEAKQWKEAVKSEMDSIVSNGTWVLVDLPPGCTTIGCKWIFKKKLKPDGSIDKFKARLVAKGFKQKEGIDYFDTYSPVARLTTIRVLIALASVYNLSIHQMDVKTAFLYGELEEEIYMDQPEGFVAHGNERKVCKLVKSLYGLKQAPKQWHEKFDQTILAFGFTVNENDKCIYCKVKGDR
ncbi:UNVERIFIED_CONTAM: Retrovirus-related Pol polyprotein from transposon TNT 1-94 [Sesamum angustifolium]|uniref:Retrovirus-related Pol polyprotein from transposon TNT 1-94 n=1 Tax=Sesamum angustifolium TaxID=2727405 RepID=A0AAW2IYC4_9LAMI